jgi:hypothetical protein
MLVEYPSVPVGKNVKFQGLQLDDLLIGDIPDVNGPEIGLGRFGTDCGEFRALDIDLVFPTRILIGKSFQFRRHDLPSL